MGNVDSKEISFVESVQDSSVVVSEDSLVFEHANSASPQPSHLCDASTSTTVVSFATDDRPEPRQKRIPQATQEQKYLALRQRCYYDALHFVADDERHQRLHQSAGCSPVFQSLGETTKSTKRLRVAPAEGDMRVASAPSSTLAVPDADMSVTSAASWFERQRMRQRRLHVPMYERSPMVSSLIVSSNNSMATTSTLTDDDELMCSVLTTDGDGLAALFKSPARLRRSPVGRQRRATRSVTASVLLCDEVADHQKVASSHSLEPVDAATVGPITEAVVRRGLRAKLKSFSSWLLPHEATASNVLASSSSFPSALGCSLDRKWTTLPPQPTTPSKSASFLNSPRRFVKYASLKLSSMKRKTSVDQRSECSDTSTGSLNSLTRGRTPWPLPWLDALFLPDFPNRGPISHKDFVTLGTIAKGAFGMVYRVALRKQPEKVFAMKVQKKSAILSQNAVQQMKDEVAIHYQLNGSPFIAQLYLAWQNRVNLYMVTHFVSGYGDLYQLWRDEGPFGEDVVRVYAAELALALDYIHCSSVIYRDVKMENVLLDEKGHIQLVDFGLSKWLHMGERTTTICGTLQYMAPEVLTGQPYGHAADWWSLGILLHTLVTGQYPYGTAHDHLSMRITPYAAPANTSSELRGLLARLLVIDVGHRLQTIAEFQRDTFFRTLAFDSVRAKMIHPSELHKAAVAALRKPAGTSVELESDMETMETDANFGIYDERYYESDDLFHEFDCKDQFRH